MTKGKRGKCSTVPNKMKMHYRLKIMLNSIKQYEINMKHNGLNKIPHRFNIICNKYTDKCILNLVFCILKN